MLPLGLPESGVVVKAKRTRRASKSFTVNVLQQIEDSRRPWMTSAPDRHTDSHDGRMRAAIEGNLWLKHVSLWPWRKRIMAGHAEDQQYPADGAQPAIRRQHDPKGTAPQLSASKN